MKRIFAGLLFLFAMSGCLKEPDFSVDPSQYYTTYYLFYSEDVEITQPLVVFTADNENGFRQELAASASITFRNDELQLDPNLVEYRRDYNEYVPVGEFRYTDIFGSVYVNEIDLNIVGFPAGVDSIFIDDSFDFYWTGEPLEEGETLQLEIFNPQIESGEIFMEDEVGATKITIPRVGLTKVGAGEMVFNLRREKSLPADEHPGNGGELHAVYLTSQEMKLYE